MKNQLKHFDAETLQEFAEIFSQAVTRSASKSANITKLKRAAETLVNETKKVKIVIKEEFVKDEHVENDPTDAAENAIDMLLKLEPAQDKNDAQVKPENKEQNVNFEQVKKN